jgi:hypothetical protein
MPRNIPDLLGGGKREERLGGRRTGRGRRKF